MSIIASYPLFQTRFLLSVLEQYLSMPIYGGSEYHDAIS